MHLMRQVFAAVAHQIPERPALQLSVGDVVDVGERDTQWPEFVFVATAQGTGWVPARHLSVTEGRGLALEPYDTTELATSAGDLLAVVNEDLLSGWLWCRSVEGDEGWVPINTLRSSDATDVDLGR